MNVAYNSALRASKAIRADLEKLDISTSQAATITPSDIGHVSASLASFSKSVDDYQHLARQEIVRKKQEEAFERIKRFKEDLTEFRSQLDGLKKARDDSVQQSNRTELLGRRPYVNATPENPYANATSVTTNLHGRGSSFGGPQGGSMAMGSAEDMREAHALRENAFADRTHGMLDEFIARGQAVLGDLGQQREIMKGTQKRLYTVANTLGVSGDTIRMVERRAKQDKWIFGAGVVVFFLFCWLCLHYLR